MSENLKSVLKNALLGSSKPAPVTREVALMGVGDDATVEAAQLQSSMRAEAANRIDPTNASFQAAQKNLAGQATRYTPAMYAQGLDIISVDQKDIMINPVMFSDMVRLNTLPRMVQVNPLNVTFNENGDGYFAGAAIGGSQVVVHDFAMTLANGTLCPFFNNKPDTILGVEITGKAYNLERGTGSLSVQYFNQGVTAGVLPSTLGVPDLTLTGTSLNGFKIVLLRYAKVDNRNYSYKFTTGVPGTSTPDVNMNLLSTSTIKADAYELKYPGPIMADGFFIGAKNMDLWIRPLILTGNTAPAIQQAIQDPGTDLAAFLSTTY